MGMDVYGNKPKNSKGEYFRNNVWYWHPLWDYCCEVAPDITKDVTYGHSNSGDGLNGYQSIQLAKALKVEIDAGRTESYRLLVEEKKENAPLEDCYCVVSMVYGIEIIINDECKVCKGTRKIPSSLSWYNFTVENVVEFIEFLENCGGFQIC